MAISIGDAVLWIKANTTGLDEGLKKAEISVGEFVGAVGDKLKNIGAGMTAAVTLPIVGALGYATNAASDFNESASKAKVVFGDNAKAVQDFADTAARSYGISKRAATEAAGTFGNLFVTMGLDQRAAADMSVQIVKLAADLASFNNISPDEALEKLRAGLVGEAEPLRALGVNLNEAAVQAKAMELGLVGADGVISDAAKVQARYALILEQTATAQGDFARTSDGAANQSRILKAQVDNLAVSFGQNLLPLQQKLLTFLNNLLEKFNSLSPTQQRMIIAIGLTVAALGPLLLIFGQILSVVSGVLGIFTALGTAGVTLTGVISGAGAAFATLGSIAGGVMSALGAAIPAVIAVILSPIGLLVAAIVALGATIAIFGPRAWETFKMLAQIVGASLQRAGYEISQFASRIGNSLRTAAINALNSARSIGTSIVQGIQKGIQDAWASLTATLSGALDRLLAWIRNAIGAHSPSTLWADMVGAPMAQGVGVGYTRAINQEVAGVVASSSARLAGAAQGGISVQVGRIENHGSFSQGEMEMLDRRAENIAQNVVLRYLEGGV